jgi:hypothetical protein
MWIGPKRLARVNKAADLTRNYGRDRCDKPPEGAMQHDAVAFTGAWTQDQGPPRRLGAAGVIFQPENGGGAGVRLKKV